MIYRMVRPAVYLVALGIGIAQPPDSLVDGDYPYSAAMISTVNDHPGHTELVIFPFRGNARRIPITSAASLVFSSNGTVLYGQCSTPEGAIALCRIDPQSTSIVPGSTGLYARDVAVSPDESHFLVSGVWRRATDVRGLFDLRPSNGDIKPLFVQTGRPSLKSGFNYLSLSPSGERAVAIHNDRLVLIDLIHHTMELIGDKFFMGAWSPDGKWLAAVELGENGRTILMDARDLTRRRVLAHTELGWSPDSRYLLGLKHCDEYHGTLEAINIQTGKRISIDSSRCQVNQPNTGWTTF